MTRPNYLKEIRQVIDSAECGAAFVTTDFTDITDKQTANIALARLADEGLIKRALRGVYYKPGYNHFLGECIEPFPGIIAKAIARNYGWTIVPCGDTALNLLGLSTQVPAVLCYVSDGPYKKYLCGKTAIVFKRTTNKEISKLSYLTALVVQALKALGKNGVDMRTIALLHNSLSLDEKARLIEETRTVTSWVHEYIKEICEE